MLKEILYFVVIIFVYIGSLIIYLIDITEVKLKENEETFIPNVYRITGVILVLSSIFYSWFIVIPAGFFLIGFANMLSSDIDDIP